MSILEVPRILFRGDISWDPIVTNNSETFYDESTGEPVFQAVADKVKAFRQQAIGAVTTGGVWNPHGTHRSTFYDASISAVDLGSGLDSHDPFVSSAANFSGMLVDLEPYGAFSSQLFFDRMVFGVDGGYRILARRSTRVTARYINFARNPANNIIAGIASVVWQTSFGKQDGLRVDAFDSPALQALDRALQTDDVIGLTVRFNAYRTIYFEDPTLSNRSPELRKVSLDLQTKLNNGGFQPNPARSRVVGAIGLWRKDEPLHEPGDRALLPGDESPLGAAFARLGDGSLTLDLANCVPESSRDLTKTDLGPLAVVAVDPKTSTPTTLGTLTYDQYDCASYESSSGIVIIRLTPALAEAAAGQDIQLRDHTGAVLLAEQRLRAIPLTPNLYLDEGDSIVAAFQVYDRGTPATSATPITLYTMSADGGTIDNTQSLTTDAAGVLSFPVAATAPGIVPLVASPMAATPPTQGINPQVNTYMYARTLPADAATGALPASWDNVYTVVLANWNAMAPCMDNWLNLADPAQVKACAAIITQLTDPANFESYRFMPVTRDMTIGERTLLHRFLAGEADETATHAAAAPATAHFAALSRTLRRA